MDNIRAVPMNSPSLMYVHNMFQLLYGMYEKIKTNSPRIYSFVKDKDTLFHKMIKPSSTYIYNFLSSLMISSKQYKFIMLVKLLAL